MKDKEWLKEQVDELFHAACEIGKMEYHEADQSVYVINGLVDQLDEPEIEENFYTFDNAKKWLQDNGFVVFEKDNLDEEVQRMIDETYEATNEKPTIPQYVADWIEKQMKFGYECVFISMSRLRETAPEKVKVWFDDNPDTYARAWLDGYEVNKEKKYYIYDKSTKGYLGYNADKTRLSWYTSQFPNDVFTEQEIKAIDERYWAFAEEVTE